MSTICMDDQKLTIELPDEFELISLEQLQTLYGMGYPNMWGARDETHHVLVTLIWKDSGELLSKLANEKFLAKRVEKSLSKSYRKKGYRYGGPFTTRIAGRDACAFRYSYEPEGIPHACEVAVFRDGGRCYTLYYYTRAEMAQTNRTAYEAMLESLAIKD